MATNNALNNATETLNIGATVDIDGTINSDTMTGATATNLTSALGVKNYIDNANNAQSVMAKRNLINGGDFSINPWQAGTSFPTLSANTFVADGWRWLVTGTGRVTITKETDAPTRAQAAYLSNHSLKVDVTTADASIAASDKYSVVYHLEGYDFVSIAEAPFTLSFWVKGGKTGTHTVAFQNAGQDRSFVAEYTISVADTWEYKEVTITASPAAGTWDYTNGVGLYVYFNLAAGSTFHTTAGSWQTGNVITSAAAVNEMDSAVNNFLIDLVQLQAGSTATPFILQQQDKVLSKAQRYFCKTFPQGVTPVQNVGNFIGTISFSQYAGNRDSGMMWYFKSSMRTTPSLTFYNPAAANNLWRSQTGGMNCGTPSGVSLSSDSVYAFSPANGNAAEEDTISIHATADARLS